MKSLLVELKLELHPDDLQKTVCHPEDLHLQKTNKFSLLYLVFFFSGEVKGVKMPTFPLLRYWYSTYKIVRGHYTSKTFKIIECRLKQIVFCYISPSVYLRWGHQTHDNNIQVQSDFLLQCFMLKSMKTENFSA